MPLEQKLKGRFISVSHSRHERIISRLGRNTLQRRERCETGDIGALIHASNWAKLKADKRR
jgi:hypothetical protein